MQEYTVKKIENGWTLRASDWGTNTTEYYYESEGDAYIALAELVKLQLERCNKELQSESR